MARVKITNYSADRRTVKLVYGRKFVRGRAAGKWHLYVPGPSGQVGNALCGQVQKLWLLELTSKIPPGHKVCSKCTATELTTKG